MGAVDNAYQAFRERCCMDGSHLSPVVKQNFMNTYELFSVYFALERDLRPRRFQYQMTGSGCEHVARSFRPHEVAEARLRVAVQLTGIEPRMC